MDEFHPSIRGFEALLESPNTPDAEERLEALVTLLRNAPQTDEGNRVFEATWKTIESADPSGSSKSIHLAWCFLLICRARFYRGDAYSGLEPASRALAIANNAKDPGLQARAAKLMGAMYLETGNYPEAITSFSRALDAAQRADDIEQQVGILSNLGLAHQYSGHYSLAIPCYERAAQLSDDAESASLSVWSQGSKATALSNMALACLHMRDYQRGIVAAELATKTLAAPANMHEQVIRAGAEYYFTRLLMELRSPTEAREHAALARQYSVGTTDLGRMFGDLAQGLVEVYDNASRDIGLSRLQTVVDASRKGTASMLREALSTIVRAYEIAGQPNSALVYLHEIQDLNRDSRIRNVLLHHNRHIETIRKRQDVAAEAAMDEKLAELRVQRLSVDALRE